MIPSELSPCRSLIEKDPILYLDLTEPLRRGEGHVAAACPTGALVVLENCDRGFSLLAADRETAGKLLSLLPPDPELVFVHEEAALSLLHERFGLTPSPAFYQGAYLRDTPLPLPDTGAEIRPLDLTSLPVLSANYKYGDEAYLRQLLARRVLWGAFEGDALLAFIGLHSEGTMGLLEVLPPYRGRGLARLLESYLINRELSLGHIPYCQIFERNGPSLALQASLGLTLSRGRLWFAERTSGIPIT